MESQQTWKPKWVYFLGVAGWLFVFFLGTELFVRVFLFSPQPLVNLKGGDKFELWGMEGYGITRYLPFAEARTPYAAGTYDVVVLGNSFTLANQVMDWQSYSSVAESILNTEDIQVDIHNLGINGAALPSHIARGPFVMEQYDPDIVVVQIAPSDFLLIGFNQALRGGYFQVTPAGAIVLAPPPSDSARYLFPEQMEPRTTPANLLNGFAISDYLAYVREANVEAPYDGGEGIHESNPLDPAETIRQELQLLAEAFPGKPIVFIIIPGDVNTRTKTPFYKDGSGYRLLIDTIAQARPDWKVIFPLQEFNRSLNAGYSPKGFANSDPFRGHINAHGHQIVGEALADVLRSMLK